MPVTVAALTETDLERYNISTLTEASKLVPSFYIYHGSYAIVDAALPLYSEDRHYEIALIGRNLSDKIYALSAGSRPGACVNQGPPTAPIFEGSCDGTAPANAQDQVTTTSLGRQLTLQFRARL